MTAKATPTHTRSADPIAARMGSAPFVGRHIGPDSRAIEHMLSVVGFDNLGDFLASVLPEAIRWPDALSVPAAVDEATATAELARLAAGNRLLTSMIGLGYYDTMTPAVLRRNILENPAWYTAYTPYQPEISQGRLEALLNFQTMVEDLTGLPIAGSSLLDEPTAAAEAMGIALRSVRANRVLVDADTHPQTLAVIATRAEPLGVELIVADLQDPLPSDVAAVLISYPGSSGRIIDPRPVIESAHQAGALAIVITDLLGLTMLTPPGNSAPTSPWARHSASGYRWASGDRMQASSPFEPALSAACPADSSG